MLRRGGGFSRLKSENKMLKKRNKCLEGDVKDLKKEVADIPQIVANIKGNGLKYTVSLLDFQRCQKKGGKGTFQHCICKLACFLVETIKDSSWAVWALVSSTASTRIFYLFIL